jgi:hypothetical protein
MAAQPIKFINQERAIQQVNIDKPKEFQQWVVTRYQLVIAYKF